MTGRLRIGTMGLDGEPRERVEARAQTGGHDVGAQRGVRRAWRGARRAACSGGSRARTPRRRRPRPASAANGARSTPASVTMAAMLAAGVTSKAG